ncbi:hypothetical protein ACM25P_15995 [Vreelandella alkaliphila]|uniref:hypothetical protein n=1 Tax=Vreelandella alkaliphila TaxID=272774 RepID=UPI0039F50599
MENPEIREKVREYFLNACKPLDRDRYTQESAYVDAFIGRLDGELDFGPQNGSIKFTPTIVADRGPGSAENKFGADFAIVFQSMGVEAPTQKAIISQAKNGSVDKLSKAETERLQLQCKKMARVTTEYLILEAPMSMGAMPTVRFGDKAKESWEGDSIAFDEYFLEHVLSCRHGDRRSSFVKGVATSNLSGIKVDVDGLEYTPEKKPRKKRSRKPSLGNNGGKQP